MHPSQFAVVALIAVAPLVALAEPDPDWKAGDKVEIFDGNKWYPGVVLKAGDGKWFIHYDNYSDSWDSWVGPDKLRKIVDPAKVAPPAAAEAAAAGDPSVGERCEGSWNQSWYEIEILEVKAGKYFVHWRGYPKDSDEWLTRERIRRKGEDKEVLPRKGREGNGGGLAPEKMIGKEVEVFWHGKWWPAVVQKTDGQRLHIRYAGADFGKMEEWAVKERVREVGGASRVKVDPASVPGKKGLSGFWWRQYGNPSAMTEQHFLFFPDGRLVLNPWVSPDEVDFAALSAEYPEGCGGYGLDGETLHIELGGDADEWKPLKFERVTDDLLKLNGIPTMRVKPFPNDFRLAGKYVSIDAGFAGSMGGGLTRNSAVIYVFRMDGTYDHTSTTTVSMAGDAPEQRVEASQGTYEFAGNHITLKHRDGVQSYMSYPKGHADAPYEMLRIGIHIMKLRKD